MKKLILKKLILIALFFAFSHHITQAAAYKDAQGKTHLLNAEDRLAATSWLEAELFLSLNLNLVAMADKKGFKEWVDTLSLPKHIVDLGDRHKPSLELLKEKNIGSIFLKSNDLNKDLIPKVVPDTIILDAATIMDYHKSQKIYKDIAKSFNREELAEKNLTVLKDSVNNLKDTLAQNNIKNTTLIGYFKENTFRSFNKDHSLNQILSEAGADIFQITEKENVWNSVDISTNDFVIKAKNKPIDLLIYVGTKEGFKKFNQNPIFQSFIKKNKIKVVYSHSWTWGNILTYTKFVKTLTSSLR